MDLRSASELAFDKLDNLLWLVGKINRGNYSLILKEDEYLKLVQSGNFKEFLKIKKIEFKNYIKNKGKKFSSTNFDDVIKEYNIKNLNNIFSDKLLIMIDFSMKNL